RDKMNIGRALQIRGWMHDDELKWLAQQASQRNLIVEIGSFKGRSTRALGDNTLGRVIAIDHWRGEEYVPMSDFDRDNLFGDFCFNLEDLILSEKVIPYQRNSRDINSDPELMNLNPDFVFIDGSHLYEDVK